MFLHYCQGKNNSKVRALLARRLKLQNHVDGVIFTILKIGHIYGPSILLFTETFLLWIINCLRTGHLFST